MKCDADDPCDNPAVSAPMPKIAATKYTKSGMFDSFF